MEMMQLQMLVAVAEEGTLQKAADRVYRTQPAVSIAIGKLEEEVGAALLDRSQGRDFRLTPAGEVLVGYARRLLAVRDEALAAIEGIRNLKSGILRIGANQSVGEYLLPRLVEEFRKRHPAVKLRISIGYSDAILSALKHHQLDIALVASQPNDPQLRGSVIAHDRLVAVFSPKHPLATHRVVHIQELGTEPMIVLTPTSELRERISQAFKRLQVPLNVQVETETLESIKNMAAAGMGVGIIPHMCMKYKGPREDLTMKTIEEFQDERSVWLVVRHTSASPACQAFIKTVKSELQNLPERS